MFTKRDTLGINRRSAKPTLPSVKRSTKHDYRQRTVSNRLYQLTVVNFVECPPVSTRHIYFAECLSWTLVKEYLHSFFFYLSFCGVFLHVQFGIIIKMFAIAI